MKFRDRSWESIVNAMDQLSADPKYFKHTHLQFVCMKQSDRGRSKWADFLRDNWLSPEEVIWAFVEREENPGHFYREWLGVRVDLRNRVPGVDSVYYINMKNDNHKDFLNKLANKYNDYIDRIF
jgi:hypothetical protein